MAFARALVMGQEILLLDEPLSNLDAKLRVDVRTELRQIQQKLGITAMYVTHDQDEALSMSDIIAVMRKGRIEQIGTPWEIYFRPATRFVADFVGTVNFLEGTARRDADGGLTVDHLGMRLRVDEGGDFRDGEAVTLVVRPECIRILGGRMRLRRRERRSMHYRELQLPGPHDPLLGAGGHGGVRHRRRQCGSDRRPHRRCAATPGYP